MEQRKENKLGTMPMGKLIASVSLPLMVSMLVQSLYNIVDGIYVAKISEDALTATSLAFPAQMLMISVAVGTGVGLNSLLARKLGEKRFDEANATATNGLLLAGLNTIVFMLLGFFAVRPFISAFTDNPEIIEMGVSYLSVCMVWCVGIFLSITGERLLQATGNSIFSMTSQIVGAVTNIILDPILIFGKLGMPEMGIKGAAVATVIGQIFGAVVAIVLNKVKNKEIHFVFRGFRPSGAIILNIYKVGIPSIIMQSIGTIMMVGMNKILILFSTTAVAVFGIYFKLQSFVFMPVFGLTQGLIPIVGYNYGARRPDRLMHGYKLATVIAVIIMAIGTAIFWIIPKQLLLMFDASEEMLSIGIQALRIISLTFLPAAISIVAGNTLAGIGNGVVSMINSFLRQLVILLPAAFLLASAFGLDFAWYAMCISEIVSLVFTMLMFKREYNKKIKPMEEETGLCSGVI
ncbi:MAG: MATE family efflux transporter [Oscillospiraceae bacterium]